MNFMSYEHLVEECLIIPVPPQYKQPTQAPQQALNLEQAMVNLSKVVGDFVLAQKSINAHLSQRIDSVESSLNKRMDEVQNDLSQKIDNLQDSISRFANLNTVQEKGNLPSQPYQNSKGIHEVEAKKEESSMVKEVKTVITLSRGNAKMMKGKEEKREFWPLALLPLSGHIWSISSSPFYTYYIPFRSSGSQESNASNGVQIGVETKKLWSLQENWTELSGNFAHLNPRCEKFLTVRNHLLAHECHFAHLKPIFAPCETRCEFLSPKYGNFARCNSRCEILILRCENFATVGHNFEALPGAQIMHMIFHFKACHLSPSQSWPRLELQLRAPVEKTMPLKETTRAEDSDSMPLRRRIPYGEIISIVTAEGIKLCNDFKLKQQMKNEQKIYKNEFGSFCSQFGFSQKETMPPSKQKPSRKPSKDKFYHSERGTHDNYRMSDTKQSRHFQRRVNKDTQKKVMLNSTDSESRTDSDNEDDINQLDSSGGVSSQSSSDQAECIKGAVENCLQEGLVPIPLCEETSQSLFGANGKRLAIMVHETMAPKKNTQAPNQKTQPSQAPSPHKMLWSQQVEEEEARFHSSNPMPNKMMTLYYDHSDPANPVKATQYPAISGQAVFPQGPTQVSASDDMSQFFLKKQQLQAMLAAAKTPQDFQKILEEGSSSFSQENSYVESDDSTSYLPDNGDDCEGIFLQ
ncbi:hypothetical protein CK203_107445 [Vitis vinifera]|uniref:Uncharacterized protein n=1 Tax=Vitis vinifera TaxID=29760 RepID=A0A438FHX4_VITVI|nr:hypothetical protein CK203_107445 [Vitis vinifera]